MQLVQEKSYKESLPEVIGPTSSSVWFRPLDERQVVIVGEHHILTVSSKRVLCPDGVSFLNWFLLNIEPRIQDWHIFFEMEPATIDPEFSLTPIPLLYRYLNDNKQLKAKIHWVDTRQDSDYGSESLASLYEFLEQATRSKDASDIKKTHEYLSALLQNTLDNVKRASYFIEKQISKMEYPHDRSILRGLLQSNLELLQSLDYNLNPEKSRLTPDELNRAYFHLYRISISFMDLYFVSRMMKPYVHNALLLCGDAHRLNIEHILYIMGFKKIFPQSEYFGYSCATMPGIYTSVKDHPPFPRRPRPFPDPDPVHLALSQLKSKIRHPYRANQLNTSIWDKVSDKEILNLAKKSGIDVDVVKQAIEEMRKNPVSRASRKRKVTK